MSDDYSALFARQTPVRGKYYERALRQCNLVAIDPDLLEVFASAAELNAALRGLVEAARHVRAKG
ncbi:hypothetical protein [Amphibiibacter pelophylacis]|uniref:Uncharacterized protein n=1 Tax=Amphibiibacter pelophylacis TaxID=1799477 RepID=A0ACC6P3U5_9BURK